jgi:hypothetical protein
VLPVRAGSLWVGANTVGAAACPTPGDAAACDPDAPPGSAPIDQAAVPKRIVANTIRIRFESYFEGRGIAIILIQCKADANTHPHKEMSMNRWLIRLSMSFFIIAAVLAWSAYQALQHGAPIWQSAMDLFAAAAAITLGAAGVRLKHQSRD